MIVHKIRGNFARGFLGALAAVCAALILLQPQNAAQGVQEGLLLCYNSLIPSLFPFLILTRILLDTGACRSLGLPLLPYCRLLGIRNTRAASTVAIGLLGGFAAAGCGIDALFRNGVLTAHQSSLLLCVCAVEGPAFFLFAVGASVSACCSGSAFCSPLCCAAWFLRVFCRGTIWRTNQKQTPRRRFLMPRCW